MERTRNTSKKFLEKLDEAQIFKNESDRDRILTKINSFKRLVSGVTILSVLLFSLTLNREISQTPSLPLLVCSLTFAFLWYLVTLLERVWNHIDVIEYRVSHSASSNVNGIDANVLPSAKIIEWEGKVYRVDLSAKPGSRVMVKEGPNFVSKPGLGKLGATILYEGRPINVT